MNTTEVVGYLAASLTTLAFVPQVLRIWRTRSAQDLSLGMYVLFGLGVVLWLAYGLLTHAWPVVIANAITLVLTCAALWGVWRFRR